MQYRDVLLQQRVRCIAEKFQERTANEAEPLSRDRILEVIRAIVADLEGELRREAVRQPRDRAARNQAPQISRA